MKYSQILVTLSGVYFLSALKNKATLRSSYLFVSLIVSFVPSVESMLIITRKNYGLDFCRCYECIL